MRATRTLQNMGLSNEMNVVNGISCVAKAPQTTFKWCAVDRGRGEDRERQVNEGCEVQGENEGERTNEPRSWCRTSE
jgi:hypothetical protein